MKYEWCFLPHCAIIKPAPSAQCFIPCLHAMLQYRVDAINATCNAELWCCGYSGGSGSSLGGRICKVMMISYTDSGFLVNGMCRACNFLCYALLFISYTERRDIRKESYSFYLPRAMPGTAASIRILQSFNKLAIWFSVWSLKRLFSQWYIQ